MIGAWAATRRTGHTVTSSMLPISSGCGASAPSCRTKADVSPSGRVCRSPGNDRHVGGHQARNRLTHALGPLAAHLAVQEVLHVIAALPCSVR